MEYVKLKDVSIFVRNGANIKQDKECKKGYPITRIETLANDMFNRNRMGYANIHTLDKFSEYILEDGDILYSHINGEKQIGRSVMYSKKGDEIIIHGMNLLCIRPDKQKIIPKFLEYSLQSSVNKIYIQQNTKKAVNQASIPSSKVLESPIVIYDLEKQDNIVKELNLIKTNIDLCNSQLEHLDNIVKSQFIEMFGTIDTNVLNWKISPIKDFARCIAGATPSTSVKEYWENGTIPWMSSGEVNKERIYETDTKITQLGYDNSSTKLIPPHTVVMAMAGQGKTRGTVAMAEIELCTNQSICSIVANDTINPEYLLYFLKSQYNELRESSNGDGGRGGLNLKIIGDFKSMVPPIELQNKFASFVQQIDKSKFLVQKQIKLLEELLEKKMNEYFGQ